MYKVTIKERVNGKFREYAVRICKTEKDTKQFARAFLNQSGYSVTIEEYKRVDCKQEAK